jgi:hypothetical protein
VVKAAHSWTFDPRGAVDIELEKVRQLAKVVPASVPTAKKADAQRLNQAYAKDAEQELLRLELSSRGYSSQVQEQALRPLQTSKSNEISYADQVLLDIMRQQMPASEYNSLRKACDIGMCFVLLEALRREPWIEAVSASWNQL